MVDRTEGVESGYPGFLVMRPPRLTPTPATLKRVALAKLAGIRLIGATFAGDRLLFQPWLTTLIDEGARISLTGIYRTDSALGHESDEGDPTFCLRKSTWLRDADLASAKNAQDVKSYLLTDQEVDHTFTFTSRSRTPEIVRITEGFMASIRDSELSLHAIDGASSRWEFVSMEVGDEVRAFRVDYSPLTTSIALVEAVLPRWLASLDQALSVAGFEPDGPLTISIDRSVPELIG